MTRRIVHASVSTTNAKRSDHEWFEQHPDRQYRVRPIIPGEDTLSGKPHDTPSPGRRLAFVKQFEPGVRLRILRTTPFDVAPINNDAAIAEIFADDRLAPTVISRMERCLAGDAVARSKILDVPGSVFVTPVAALAVMS